VDPLHRVTCLGQVLGAASGWSGTEYRFLYAALVVDEHKLDRPLKRAKARMQLWKVYR